jgi:hypothetical protein
VLDDAPARAAGLELEFGSVRIRVMHDFDAATLQRLVRQLLC